jgi:hypothetical protein
MRASVPYVAAKRAPSRISVRRGTSQCGLEEVARRGLGVSGAQAHPRGCWFGRVGRARATALNAATYLDQAIRTRPATETPRHLVLALADTAGVEIPGAPEHTGDRLDLQRGGEEVTDGRPSLRYFDGMDCTA